MLYAGLDLRERINKGPLSERRILELEDAANLPAWAPPALRQQGDDYEIGVAGLYWGFHRLLRSLFADKKQSNAGEGLAHHLYF
jgi:hypothetical protein